MLSDIDSWDVAMEVGNVQGVCNNSPTESGSRENGWRYPATDTQLAEHWLCQVGGRGGCLEADSEGSCGASSSADLGGSSKYLGESPRGRSGEGFLNNCVWLRVSRS